MLCSEQEGSCVSSSPNCMMRGQPEEPLGAGDRPAIRSHSAWGSWKSHQGGSLSRVRGVDMKQSQAAGGPKQVLGGGRLPGRDEALALLGGAVTLGTSILPTGLGPWKEESGGRGPRLRSVVSGEREGTHRQECGTGSCCTRPASPHDQDGESHVRPSRPALRLEGGRETNWPPAATTGWTMEPVANHLCQGEAKVSVAGSREDEEAWRWNTGLKEGMRRRQGLPQSCSAWSSQGWNQGEDKRACEKMEQRYTI